MPPCESGDPEPNGPRSCGAARCARRAAAPRPRPYTRREAKYTVLSPGVRAVSDARPRRPPRSLPSGLLAPRVGGGGVSGPGRPGTCCARLGCLAPRL